MLSGLVGCAGYCAAFVALDNGNEFRPEVRIGTLQTTAGRPAAVDGEIGAGHVEKVSLHAPECKPEFPNVAFHVTEHQREAQQLSIAVITTPMNSKNGAVEVKIK